MLVAPQLSDLGAAGGGGGDEKRVIWATVGVHKAAVDLGADTRVVVCVDTRDLIYCQKSFNFRDTGQDIYLLIFPLLSG